ncbi:hypothetical protein MHBO_005300 [Bonamia ostreae]|uniref:Uncharacterized protein n=1 Tax=Bonamia ostreae TaxID=126728 RepID=A0ABV2AKP9_9EUKA
MAEEKLCSCHKNSIRLMLKRPNSSAILSIDSAGLIHYTENGVCRTNSDDITATETSIAPNPITAASFSPTVGFQHYKGNPFRSGWTCQIYFFAQHEGS